MFGVLLSRHQDQAIEIHGYDSISLLEQNGYKPAFPHEHAASGYQTWKSTGEYRHVWLEHASFVLPRISLLELVLAFFAFLVGIFSQSALVASRSAARDLLRRPAVYVKLLPWLVFYFLWFGWILAQRQANFAIVRLYVNPWLGIVPLLAIAASYALFSWRSWQRADVLA